MFYITNSTERDIINTTNLLNIYKNDAKNIGLIYGVNKEDSRLTIGYYSTEERDAEFERFIKFLIKTGQAIEQDYVINIHKNK